jgi:hypothetical protein
MDELRKSLDELLRMLSDGNNEKLKNLIQKIVHGYQFNGQVNSLPIPEKECDVALL